MSTEHWASIQEAGALSGLRFMFGVYRWFGRLPFRVLLYPVILYFFLFRPQARRASLEYLGYLEDAGLLTRTGSRVHLSYRHFLSFGDCLLDKLSAWQGDISRDNLRFHNHQLINELANEGRGAMIIGSHLGNLEICRALAQSNAGIKLNVLMHTAHATKFNEMLKRAGSDSQVNIIQTTEINPATAIVLQQKLDQGEFVVIAGDRTPVSGSHNTSQVRFLGHPSEFPHGPFILAAILKCPVLTMFCLRRDGVKQPAYDLYLDHFADRIVLPRKQRKEQLHQYNQAYADLLARYCAKAPLQWYNFYSFWAATPAAERTATNL